MENNPKKTDMKKVIYILLLFISTASFAQDKIVKKDGSEISCIVTEVGVDEVKYHYSDKPKVSFSLDKALITRIEFETGEIIEVKGKAIDNPDYYSEQNKHALKIGFLSPLAGSTEITYEQSIKPGKSWETALGIIGLGFDPQDDNARGVYGKVAYKFMRSPSFYANRMRYDHILKGGYIAPELAFRYVNYDNYWYTGWGADNNENVNDWAIAFNLKFGKQWVFDDSFLVDVFWGFGYGYSKNAEDGLNYGFVAGDSDVPISITGGLRLGWTF